MKKTLMLTLLLCIAAFGQKSFQWDFFKNVIPKHKSISISDGSCSGAGQWTMTIDDKYNVSFSCSTPDGSMSFKGNSIVVWENERMKIKLPIYGSEYYYTSALGNNNAIIAIERNGSGRWNIEFELKPEYTGGKFSGNLELAGSNHELTFVSTASYSSNGNVFDSRSETRRAYINARKYEAKLSPKSESEINEGSKDEFGEWNWNTDRTKIFLKSRNSNNKFVVWNKSDGLFWSMEMEKNAKGASEGSVDSGERLVNLSMSFDGVPATNYSFVENKDADEQDALTLDYATYNRFQGTLDKKAESVLGQIKNKSMLILTYISGNATKTDMYMLDGLSAILKSMGKGGSGNQSSNTPASSQPGKLTAAAPFTDTRDGQTYNTTQTPNGRVWMTDNLNYKAANSKCYDNKDANCTKHCGRLYPWLNATLVCPNGWHLPSKEEWQVDQRTGIPVSLCGYSNNQQGDFQGYKKDAGLWLSDKHDANNAYGVTMSNNNRAANNALRPEIAHHDKEKMFSVKCVKD